MSACIMTGKSRQSIIMSPVFSFGFLIIFCPGKFFSSRYLKRDRVGHIERIGLLEESTATVYKGAIAQRR